MYYPPQQQQQPPQHNPQQPIIYPTPPRGRYRPRFGWVAFLVIAAGIILLLMTVGMAFDWGDVVDFADVANPDSFASLAMLGGALVVLTIIAKALRGRRSNTK
jgi:hypothetical protein